MENTPDNIEEFAAIYETRRQTEALLASASDVFKVPLEQALQAADARLAEMAADPAVSQYYSSFQPEAAEAAAAELEEVIPMLLRYGMDEEVAAKRAELEAMRDDRRTAAAAYFARLGTAAQAAEVVSVDTTPERPSETVRRTTPSAPKPTDAEILATRKAGFIPVAGEKLVGKPGHLVRLLSTASEQEPITRDELVAGTFTTEEIATASKAPVSRVDDYLLKIRTRLEQHGFQLVATKTSGKYSAQGKELTGYYLVGETFQPAELPRSAATPIETPAEVPVVAEPAAALPVVQAEASEIDRSKLPLLRAVVDPQGSVKIGDEVILSVITSPGRGSRTSREMGYNLSLDMLTFLAAHPGRMFARRDILDAIRPGVDVGTSVWKVYGQNLLTGPGLIIVNGRPLIANNGMATKGRRYGIVEFNLEFTTAEETTVDNPAPPEPKSDSAAAEGPAMPEAQPPQHPITPVAESAPQVDRLAGLREQAELLAKEAVETMMIRHDGLSDTDVTAMRFDTTTLMQTLGLPRRHIQLAEGVAAEEDTTDFTFNQAVMLAVSHRLRNELGDPRRRAMVFQIVERVCQGTVSLVPIPDAAPIPAAAEAVETDKHAELRAIVRQHVDDVLQIMRGYHVREDDNPSVGELRTMFGAKLKWVEIRVVGTHMVRPAGTLNRHPMFNYEDTMIIGVASRLQRAIEDPELRKVIKETAKEYYRRQKALERGILLDDETAAVEPSSFVPVAAETRSPQPEADPSLDPLEQLRVQTRRTAIRVIGVIRTAGNPDEPLTKLNITRDQAIDLLHLPKELVHRAVRTSISRANGVIDAEPVFSAKDILAITVAHRLQSDFTAGKERARHMMTAVEEVWTEVIAAAQAVTDDSDQTADGENAQ